MSENLRFKSYAKINLGLEVSGKRPDGFHELISVMQSIGLYDTLTISKSVDVAVDGDIPRDVPGPDLVRRAADLLRKNIGHAPGARLTLRKSIPIGAGLGGGSSNAACALIGLNKLWGANLSLQELEPLAAELGSDVPFFLRGGTALAEGRGDETSALPEPPMHQVVIAMPQRSLSAARVYKHLESDDFSDGAATRSLAKGLSARRLRYSEMRNSLQGTALSLCPQIDELTLRLRKLGSKVGILSGSGSACFGLFTEREPALRAAAELQAAGFWSTTCPFVEAWNGCPPLDRSMLPSD